MEILGKKYLLVTLDFETFYAPKYTLTAMNTFEYVDDPQFSIHGRCRTRSHASSET